MLRLSLQAKLEAGLADMGLHVSEEKQAQLVQYLLLLQKWNQVHNGGARSFRDGHFAFTRLLECIA